MAIKNGNRGDSLSRFSKLQPVRASGPFALDATFRADPDSKKVNLLIGAYRDGEGNPWQLTSVANAKKTLKIETCNHEYLPLVGSIELLEAARELVFGDELLQQANNSIASIQTISGTGANSVIAQFAQTHLHPANIWLPDPTWENHYSIWDQNAPNVTQRRYPYYNDCDRSFDFQGMMRVLQEDAQENDAILLHACAHNPTGLDPTREQWQEIAILCNEKKLFVIFDSAYQGFASGDLDRDAWAMRHFFRYPNIEFAVCQSFSKNLGLYGERVGALHVATSRTCSPPAGQCVQGHLIDIQRSMCSMAPLFGARVATAVLLQPDLREMWKTDLEVMSGRIKAMRKALYDELVILRTRGTWEHIVEQTGMFSYTGLREHQVAELQDVYHVYLLPSGRISLCGLTAANVKYVARAIHSVVAAE
ncbi:hypothetical protein G7Z17_g6806 [Cylindrodendrum hubeiense]|uniref:Aspartate aminotransferase n=1 Tax=Cylindrodendrum hubeiense TaxID=595255 RepID=A0A9P5LGE4_9HYPO|nr:hypothetical protein G7Z17_g6806 [Cylindrodendrum hubeiense]